MILEFRTKRNANGHRKYLCIDTGAEIYSTESPRMIIEGVEIKSNDYKQLLEKLKELEYKRVKYVY